MLHTQLVATVTAIALAFAALLGSIYVLFFAIRGEWAKSANNKEFKSGEVRTRFLVLVPAHDEEEGIRSTLFSLRCLDYPNDRWRVVVIADNCTDNTAAVVREEGFECWERRQPERRGKGHALRWAIDQACELVFDAVVVIDADSVVEPSFLFALDHELNRGAIVVQAREEFEFGDNSSFSLLTVASKKAEGRLVWRPRQEMGLAIFLQGNGFCARREVLSEVSWTAYSVVEDLEYSLELLLHGIPIRYTESACIVTRLVRTAADVFPQRLRWASGTLGITIKYLPRLIASALKKRSFYLAEAGVALVLSSRPLLVYVSLVALVFSFAGLQGSPAVVVRSVIAVALAAQFAYAICVLRTVPNPQGALRAVLQLPAYICWHVIVQMLAALGVGRREWSRTVR